MQRSELHTFCQHLARLAPHLNADPWDTVIAGFMNYCDRDWRCDVIYKTPEQPQRIAKKLPQGRYLDYVILAHYRPEQPEPTAGDLLEFGAFVHSRCVTHEEKNHYIEVVDFIIAAADGSYKSVLHSFMPQAHCPRCNRWVTDGSLDGSNPKDYDLHEADCPIRDEHEVAV